MKDKQDFIVADFETVNEKTDCRVWCWAAIRNADTTAIAHGLDIESFIDYMHRNADCLFYFHNLAFDGRFILDYLLRNGFTYYKLPKRKRSLPENTVTALMSNKNKLYSLRVCFEDGETVEVRDSFKLIPMSVAAIAKGFSLTCSKGDIDYDMFRPVGYNPTPEEWDYVDRDVRIVAEALDMGYKMGLSGMTIGANCLSMYKSIIGERNFRTLFPSLSLKDDSYIRGSYRGGFTYVNPKYADKDVANGISVDYNSMYPSMMILKDYPIGAPVRFEGKYKPSKQFPLYIQTLTCMFKLKPNHVPMLQLRGRGFYGEHEYVTESVQPERITLTSVDLKLFFECYEVDVWGWEGGMQFRSMSGEQLFGAYINKWGDIKRTSTGAMRAWAKLYLNNLYGKFSTNPDVTGRVAFLDEETDTVRWRMGTPDFRDPVYLPVGTFCTAYAREALITGILENFDRFLYCDTDSMHLLGDDDPSGIRLHDSDFGAWKVEGHFTHARHIRAKCYIWDLNGHIGVTCAGMPDNIKAMCNFDNFHIGFKNTDDEGNVLVGKLTPVVVKGGVVLEKRRYELKA